MDVNGFVAPATAPTGTSRTAAPVRFGVVEAQRAADAWGANCGPGALAAVLGLTLDELRPSLGRCGFERRGYMSPSMMFDSLDLLAHGRWRRSAPPLLWPDFGLCRVQWSGPWLAPGVPVRVAYGHTHWIGARQAARPRGGPVEIFDINCICAGGWVPLAEWTGQVVPWLLRTAEPKADGNWHLTHVVEVTL